MTNAARRFAVIRTIAHFDEYDRIIGWSQRQIATTHTKAWALALRDREDFDHDVGAEVRYIATGKLVRRWEMQPEEQEFTPF